MNATEPATIRHRSLSVLIATGFGVGYSPLAPGTMGSIVGGALFLVLRGLPPAAHAILLVGLFVGGALVAGAGAEAFAAPDPGAVVIDEIMGCWTALLLAGPGWAAVGAAFLLFRFFDTLKPFPISWTERLPGGWGIMADDVAAAAYTGAFLWLIRANFDVPF